MEKKIPLIVEKNKDVEHIMLAGARAIEKIKKDGGQGAYTPFDIPPSYFAPFKCENVNNYL